ncbi:MAG: ArsC family reductase [Gammaproteobacteria bacterium]
MHMLYGISNCDTVKRTRAWLDKHDVIYRFHDFRKQGLEQGTLQTFINAAGWELLLNRRGMTWRKLSDTDKSDLNEGKALALMLAHPTVIRRPVLMLDKTCFKKFHVGFQEAEYQNLFSAKE